MQPLTGFVITVFCSGPVNVMIGSHSSTVPGFVTVMALGFALMVVVLSAIAVDSLKKGNGRMNSITILAKIAVSRFIDICLSTAAYAVRTLPSSRVWDKTFNAREERLPLKLSIRVSSAAALATR